MSNEFTFKDLTVELQNKLGDLSAHIDETRSLAETKLTTAEADERFERTGKELVEVSNAIAAAQSAHEAETRAREEMEEALSERIDELETRLSRTAASTEADGLRNEHRQAMAMYLSNPKSREAADFLSRAEFVDIKKRALSEGINVDGGYMVEPMLADEIIKNVVAVDPIMDLARITTIDGTNEWKVNQRTSGPTGYWVEEDAAPTASASKYKQITIPVHICGVETAATTALLQDVNYVESEMTADATEAIADTLGEAFLKGDGNGKPTGITQTTLNGVDTVAGGDTSTYLVQANDFYSLLYGNGTDGTGLYERYRANSTFVMNSLTLGKVQKLTDDYGAYIWQTNLQGGAPATIAGRPYRTAEGMDSDGANTNKPLMLGDFRRGYRIVRRSDIWTLRDPYSSKPNVEINWYVRYGGKVVQAEAIKVLTV